MGSVNWYYIEADSLSGDNRLFHYIGACKRFALFRELQKAEFHFAIALSSSIMW